MSHKWFCVFQKQPVFDTDLYNVSGAESTRTFARPVVITDKRFYYFYFKISNKGCELIQASLLPTDRVVF